MAVTDETLRLIEGLRLHVRGTLDRHDEQLIQAWSRAWNEVAPELRSALDELVAASSDGRWPTPMQIRRAERAQRALAVVRDALEDLAAQLPVTVASSLPVVTGEALEWQRRITASQLPAGGHAAQLVASLHVAEPRALTQIIERTTQQVTARSRPMAARATAAMKSALVKGVAVGDHPYAVADDMLERLGGVWQGGLGAARARVIARTEMLDAHRAANAVWQAGNTDVITGWQWLATLDSRTCGSCLAMHGSEHPVDDPGPLDHVQGRCDRLPVVKPWRELGFAIDEPASVVPDARAWFDAQPENTRLAIVGPARLELLDSGRIGWDDLAQRRSSDGWRDSYGLIPVRDLRALAAQRAA